MISLLRREFVKLFLSFIIIICIYYSINLTLFSEKSVNRIFQMNDDISILSKKEFLQLKQCWENVWRSTQSSTLLWHNYQQNYKWKSWNMFP